MRPLLIRSPACCISTVKRGSDRSPDPLLAGLDAAHCSGALPHQGIHTLPSVARAGKLTCFLEQLHAWLFSQKPNIPLSGKRLRRAASAGGVLQRVGRLRDQLSGAATSFEAKLDACREVVVFPGGGKENRAPGVGSLAPLMLPCPEGSFATPESSPERSPTKSWGLGSAGSVRSLARTYSEDEEVSVRSCSLSCVRCACSPSNVWTMIYLRLDSARMVMCSACTHVRCCSATPLLMLRSMTLSPSSPIF